MLSDQPPLLPSLRAQQFLGWVRNRFTPVVATRRDRYLFRALANAADLYLDMFANRCYEFDINGEARVLEALSEPPPRCVFDVGANVGDWSAIAARLFANAEIHAFEIVPETARTMEDRLTRAGLTSVHLNAFGLSDAPGTVRVAHLPGFSQGSSAAAAPPDGGEVWQECRVETGDAYCREHGIDHIDFLKVDVEGLESKVLSGFADMLRAGRVDVVQFEYGRLNAAVRFLLGDFYDLFDGYGYTVGKVFPDGVDFSPYNAWRDEDFRGPNYVAVQRSRADLVPRLASAR
jgi:FkbM family methyltransferase